MSGSLPDGLTMPNKTSEMPCPSEFPPKKACTAQAGISIAFTVRQTGVPQCNDSRSLHGAQLGHPAPKASRLECQLE